MTRGWHPTWQDDNNGSGITSGSPRRKRSPSIGIIVGLGIAVVAAVLLTAAGVIAAQSPSDGAPAVEISVVESEEAVASSVVQAPMTVASSWSAEPAPASPAPAPAPASEAVRLAAEAEEAYGVVIIVEGQDWGAVDETQSVNVQAVISAVDRMPDTIVSAAVDHSYGPLTFVSNNQGRTADGWQP